MLIAVLSFLGFAYSVVLAVRYVRAVDAVGVPFSRFTLAWGICFSLFQLFLTVWSGLGFVEKDSIASVLCAVLANVAITGCVYLTFNRNVLYARLSGLFAPGTRIGGANGRPWLNAPVVLCIAGIFAMLGLEISSNHGFTWYYPLCILLEWWLITMVMLGLFYLAQRHGVAPAVLVFALFILGVAEYFVITFKSMPIQPGDLSALSTAAAVSEGYTYTLSMFCLLSMGFCCISLLLCQYATFLAFKPAKAKGIKRPLFRNLAVGLLCIAAVVGHVSLFDYYHTLGITVYTWRPLESYYRQGYIPTFISAAQTINPPKPSNYDEGEAKQLVEDYADQYELSETGLSEDRSSAEAQFEEEKPTVIAIMNETFSDLSIYENLHADYEGPTYFKSISDCLSRGKLYVSAFGGGTANSEFEFLTGNSMANLGAGVYPYTIYDLTETENLAKQFKSMGYTTTAMHPNHATNWNRENVYQDLGFDSFMAIEDFQTSEKLRGMVTDKATYEKVLELLESTDDPQFIFDVTMQNHSGYETNALPYDKRISLTIDGTIDMEINEYVSLIEQSDQALEYFINALSKLDKKVVVVFFGDHQPYFPDSLNDKWFTGEDEVTHRERLWQTNYIIWANYDVAGNSQTSEEDDLSTNYLGAKLMQIIGAPMSDYQKAQIKLRESLPAINSTGYEDASGRWSLASALEVDDSDLIASAAVKAKEDYATMQYYMMFKDGKHVYTKHYQSAANETDPNLDPGTTKIK